MATFSSGQAPKSAILNSAFINRLNSIFGFRTIQDKSKAISQFEKNYGIKFVKVDLNNEAYRIKNAALGNTFESVELTQNIQKYLDIYLHENTVSYNDIVDRIRRLNELSFMFYNDSYISGVVKLAASEATQNDVQDRIISVESPNLSFSQKCYELFSIWGITKQSIWQAFFDLELYGEAFWAQRISIKSGISKIRYIHPTDILEKMEFNPERMARYSSEKNGGANADRSRDNKIRKLVALLQSEKAFDDAENFADLFDTKIFGYELHDGNVVPPWVITHFRVGADYGEFSPYGRPPLISCLSHFKMLQSTKALDGLARVMSFPLTLFKVRIVDGTSPGRSFEIVNEVREEYSNIGVTAASSGSEMYTVNTRIWLPDNLLTVETLESKVDLGSTETLEYYGKEVARAAGVPRGYLDPEQDFAKQSGIALIEQYKPFARQIAELQDAFLQGLGEMIRLHFAVTGEYDYNTPFILSMRLPAAEMSQEQREARNATIEMTNAIVTLIKASLGLEEGDVLPNDVMEDILSKYSFLDPTDIQKWFSRTLYAKAAGEVGAEEDGGGDGGDLDFGDDSGGGDLDLGGDTGGGGDLDLGENLNRDELLKYKNLYHERQTYLKKKFQERQKMLRERYNQLNETIYFKFLESNGFTSWRDDTKGKFSRNYQLIREVNRNSPIYYSVEYWKTEGNISSYEKLKEASIEEIHKKQEIKIGSVPNERIAEAIDKSNLGTELR